MSCSHASFFETTISDRTTKRFGKARIILLYVTFIRNGVEQLTLPSFHAILWLSIIAGTTCTITWRHSSGKKGLRSNANELHKFWSNPKHAFIPWICLVSHVQHVSLDLRHSHYTGKFRDDDQDQPLSRENGYSSIEAKSRHPPSNVSSPFAPISIPRVSSTNAA